jgi:hypothetical protein
MQFQNTQLESKVSIIFKRLNKINQQSFVITELIHYFGKTLKQK